MHPYLLITRTPRGSYAVKGYNTREQLREARDAARDDSSFIDVAALSSDNELHL